MFNFWRVFYSDCYVIYSCSLIVQWLVNLYVLINNQSIIIGFTYLKYVI